MMNVGDPDHAFALASLPNDGVGLARLEFIINNHIGIHPMALVNYPKLARAEDVHEIESRIGEEDPRDFFVSRLSEGVGRIAAAFIRYQPRLRYEAVTVARDSLYILVTLRGFAQHFPEQRDALCQIVILYEAVGPDLLHQFFFPKQTPLILDQQHQHIEGFGGQLLALPLTKQETLFHIYTKTPELVEAPCLTFHNCTVEAHPKIIQSNFRVF
jgi:hypothetical protein